MPALNFQKQFAPLVEAGEKRQTIRAHRRDGRLPAKRGDTIALYTGMRTNGCRKLAEVKCTRVLHIRIERSIVFCDDGWIRGQVDLDAFAMADGFQNWRHMVDWFEDTHGLPFEGHLIEWEFSSPERTES